MISQEEIELPFHPMMDFPPPPPPPWLGDDIQCGSCQHVEEDRSKFADTFYNFAIIIVFSLSMIIILLTLSMFLYRRYKKMYSKNHQNTNINDFHIENNPKLNCNTKVYNQNYYTNMPTFLLPIYETIDGHYYSDISLSSSSSSSTRSTDRRSIRIIASSEVSPPVTEL